VTVDEAISDLLGISADIERLAVFDAGGVLLGAGSETISEDAGAAAEGLWLAAAGWPRPTPATGRSFAGASSSTS
jgi:hypothetical protein